MHRSICSLPSLRLSVTLNCLGAQFSAVATKSERQFVCPNKVCVRGRKITAIKRRKRKRKKEENKREGESKLCF